MTKGPLHFLNGKFVEEKDLVVSVNDLGFSRGYAIFDFFVTYQDKRPFMLDLHINRLFNSAKLIGMNLPWSKEQVEEWVKKTLEKNRDIEGEKMLKIFISGGVSVPLIPADELTIAITCYKRATYRKEYYENGVDLLTVNHTRYTPEAKTNNYIEGVRRMQEAKIKGAFQPLYYDDSQVFETSNANIFAVIGGRLLTPKTNILKGITRDVLIDILNEVEEKDFSLKELLGAEEVFITGSSIEIVPITKIDGKNIGDGSVGNITKRVSAQFRDFTLSDKW